MASRIKHYINQIKNGRLQDIFSSLAWLLGYSKSYTPQMLIYTALGLSGTVVSLLGSLISRDLVDIITGHLTGKLLMTFVMMISVQFVGVVVSCITQYISTYLSTKVDNSLKASLYEKIISSEWEDLSRFRSGDLMLRFSNDSSVISNSILSTIPDFFVNLFRFFAALWLVVRQDASFAIFAIASVPLSMIVSRRNLKRIQQTNMESLRASSNMSNMLQESFSNTQTIKAFDMISVYVKRLKEYQIQLTQSKMRQQKVMALNSIIMTVSTLIISYSTYGWGIYKVWSGAISYGSMTMFLALSTSLSGTIQTLINYVPNVISLSNSVKRIIEIDSLAKEDYSQYPEVSDFRDTHKNTGIGLVIENIAFAYKNGTEVFDNAGFEAYPHEAIALIGPSGEGKTTMLRLLLAIIHGQNGHGFVCPGRDTGSSETFPITASTRQLFAYVPQGNTMFSGTIAENMRNVKEDATDEEIIDALKMACAWDFVSKLPDGINSVVQERGGGFSEGQSQRLSIARALLRRSPILLLDEATSALDLKTEKALLKNIMADSYPRTTIVTTHRTSVLSMCNRVYSIENKGCHLFSQSELEEYLTT